ncbi:MAG: hypothetical protein RIT35_1388 [Pseudomonadota bacterium]|jgi:enamine deaminase RidA (YjgF/YER057c/UK114 family)
MLGIERKLVGIRMSDIVIHNGVVYLSGKVPKNLTGDIQEQTKDVLSTIEVLLEQAGSSKAHLLRVEIWLSSMSNFAAMNEVWDSWVVPEQTPTRATVEAKLAKPEYLIEIMATAALK